MTIERAAAECDCPFKALAKEDAERELGAPREAAEVVVAEDRSGYTMGEPVSRGDLGAPRWELNPLLPRGPGPCLPSHPRRWSFRISLLASRYVSSELLYAVDTAKGVRRRRSLAIAE